MVTTSFLDYIPIWALYILTFLVALLAFELGYRYGMFQQKKSKRKLEVGLDSMVGATLALLAFLLAFVISLATERFDNRRQLVVDEATAIHTTYLQAGYLPEPYPNEIRALLREYIGLRLTVTSAANIDETIARSEEIQKELWSMAEAVVKEVPARDEISLFLASLNEVINVHTRRVAAVLTSRLPSTVVLMLYLVAVLSMTMVGFQHSYSGKRNLFSILILILIFTAVIMLIIDLDRPQEGFLRVSQEALLDVQRQIGIWKP